ncbi:hypothetical protein V3589_15245 [Sinorhizobium fredii]
MHKSFDEALLELIDEYMIAHDDSDEMREDIISALELRLMAMRTTTDFRH